MQTVLRLIIDPRKLVVTHGGIGFVASIHGHALQEVARVRQPLLLLIRVPRSDLVLLLLPDLVAIASEPVPREHDRGTLEGLVQIV